MRPGTQRVRFASNLFTGQFTNLHQGYEEQHEDGSLPNQGSSKTSREYLDRLASWLDVHRDTPFFAFVHVYDPHDPFEPGRPCNTIWADPAKREAHHKDLEAVRKVISDPLLKMFRMPTRAELVKARINSDAYVKHDVDWYDRSIRGLDTEMDRLFERLKGSGPRRSGRWSCSPRITARNFSTMAGPFMGTASTASSPRSR